MAMALELTDRCFVHVAVAQVQGLQQWPTAPEETVCISWKLGCWKADACYALACGLAQVSIGCHQSLLAIFVHKAPQQRDLVEQVGEQINHRGG